MADRNPTVGCLLRLFWMGLGNGALILLALRILESNGRISPTDAVYWLLVALLVAARYLDIRHFAGTDGYGEPCTLHDWRRYTLHVVTLSGVIWSVTHLIATFRS